MKRVSLLACLVLLFAGANAMAEPLGLEAGFEADTNDLLGDEDFALAILPSLTYSIGSTGLSVGATWTMPVVPDFYKGSVDFTEEYDFTAAGIDFAITNDNDIYLDPDGDTDGILAADLTWKFINGGLEFTYLPDAAADCYIGPTYSFAIGKGSLDLTASLYFNLYEDAGIGDLTGTAGYTFPVGPVSFTAELDPTYTLSADDPEFQLTGLVSASYSF